MRHFTIANGKVKVRKRLLAIAFALASFLDAGGRVILGKSLSEPHRTGDLTAVDERS